MTAISVDPRLRARRTTVAAATHRTRVRRLIALAVLVALALGAWGASRSALLDIDEIRWSGLERVDLAAANEAAAIVAGEPIASVDTADVERRLEALAWVEQATVDRSWSGAITITVVERVPTAQVMVRQGEWAMVDAAGVVLTEPIADSTLPRVSGIAAAGVPGSILSPSAQGPLFVTQLVPAELAARVEGIARDQYGEMWITLHSADRILLGDDTQLRLKIVAATTVVEALDVEGRVGWELDVSVPTLPVVRDLRLEWQASPADGVVVEAAADASAPTTGD